MAMLATVAPTLLIIFCASMVDVSFISAPTWGGWVWVFPLGHEYYDTSVFKTVLLIMWCQFSNIVTHECLYYQHKIVTLNISSREEATHIFRNMTTPPWTLELYGVLFARDQFIDRLLSAAHINFFRSNFSPTTCYLLCCLSNYDFHCTCTGYKACWYRGK